MDDSSPARIFNIAAGQAFLPCLATTLLDGDERQALFGAAALEDVEILLPTRRAARDLAAILMQKAAAQGQSALLLPQIRTLGDLDDDAPLSEAAAALDLPPAIEPMARHYHLLPLIRFWVEKSGRMGPGGLNPVKLSALAFDLESFLDQAQNEQLDWRKLPDLVPDELSENWQETLEFLKIITEYWPQMLDEMGHMDPTARRNALLRERRGKWRTAPPTHPVIAAGSTGSIRATADLLDLVARLPNGAVILPGLDMQASDADWQAIHESESHPQYALAQLLAHMQIERGDVQPWPGSHAAGPRVETLGLALTPAENTAQWAVRVDADEKPQLDHVHLIEAPEPRAEAGAIAVLMRSVLHQDKRTAALVTRDRNLARRVALELKRWGISVDDSAGVPLPNLPLANLLRRVLACHAAGFAPVDILAVLKHPLVHLGQARGAHMAVTRQLEKRLLRGARPTGGLAGGLSGLRAALAHKQAENGTKPEDAAVLALLARMEAAFHPLAALPEPALSEAHIGALWESCIGLICADDGDREAAFAQMQQGEEGRALARLLEGLHAQSALAGPLSMADWPALLDMWLYRQPVRMQTPVDPRLMILGPLEARLMQADVMILGGLNEGSWPPLPETGPWLSRPMRADMGMSQPERQIGQAAHDFVQSAAAGEVYLTRSQKLDGSPAVAARWLRRLETVCGALPRRQGQQYLDWWQQLDAGSADDKKPARPPAPTPPVAARPNQLSVTQIETLLHNPYEIYAKKILNLREWEPVDAPPSAADRGSLLHKLFERFIDDKGHLKADAARAFMQLAEEIERDMPGGEALLVFWRARLEAIAYWLAAHEKARAATVTQSHVETSGALQLDLPGGAFTVTAKADRIDALADGRFEIIDYKTGAPPSKRRVENHESPQLTLEAAILEAGGFGDKGKTVKGIAGRLSYWQINGRTPPAKLTDIPVDADLVGGAVDMVTKLITAYRDAARPYYAHIRPGRDARAYDHLARRAEWQRAAEDGDGGSE